MSENQDYKNTTAQENAETTEQKKAEPNVRVPRKNIFDPEEQIREFGRGKMTLNTPIQDGKVTYSELKWDFLALTGAEYVDALDRDMRNVNTFRISNTQALHLFAAAAAKATGGLDAEDIRRGIGIMDAQKATQMATVFFSASNRVGNRRISNE